MMSGSIDYFVRFVSIFVCVMLIFELIFGKFESILFFSSVPAAAIAIWFAGEISPESE